MTEQEELEALRRIYRQLKFETSGAAFITGVGGKQDANGMPEYILVCPTYGLDFSYRYKRVDPE